MGEERLAEQSVGSSSCPRISGSGATPDPCFKCPALEWVEEAPGSPEHLGETVNALLGCRAFLWDVLLDGEWTGCARERLRELAAVYGSERVGAAFDV